MVMLMIKMTLMIKTTDDHDGFDYFVHGDDDDVHDGHGGHFVVDDDDDDDSGDDGGK